MDRKQLNALNQDIEYVFKRHHPNEYVGKKLTCYVVSEDGKVKETNTTADLEYASWGIVIAKISSDISYRGYYDPIDNTFYISPDAPYNRSHLILGDWEIRFTRHQIYNHLCIIASNAKFDISFTYEDDTRINLLKKMIRLLQEVKCCKTQESLDAIKCVIDGNTNSVIDQIDKLVKENTSLKKKIERIKKIVK